MEEKCPATTESKYPMQVTAFKQIIEHMYVTHLNKNSDYSPANILYAGETGVLIRIWDKFCRLCNLYGMEFPNIPAKINILIADLEKSLESDSKVTIEEILSRLRDISAEGILISDKTKVKSPKNESIEDAWLDMATYSVIGEITRRREWGR